MNSLLSCCFLWSLNAMRGTRLRSLQLGQRVPRLTDVGGKDPWAHHDVEGWEEFADRKVNAKQGLLLAPARAERYAGRSVEVAPRLDNLTVTGCGVNFDDFLGGDSGDVELSVYIDRKAVHKAVCRCDA